MTKLASARIIRFIDVWLWYAAVVSVRVQRVEFFFPICTHCFCPETIVLVQTKSIEYS